MSVDQIKKLRLEGLLTQAEFAREIGVSSTCVSLWESGVHTPGLRHQRALRAFKARLNTQRRRMRKGKIDEKI